MIQDVTIGVDHDVVAESGVVLEGVVLPGMPNLHSHGFQYAMRGLTGRRSRQGDSFWSWRERMYTLAARVEPEPLQALMAALYGRMLEQGYTSCAEFHYLHHGPDGRPYAEPAAMSRAVMAGAAAAGMALTHLPVLYTRSGFGAYDVLPEQRRFAHSVDAYLGLVEACQAMARETPLCRVGVAPHSLRAVSSGQLADLLRATPGLTVHIHVAEQPLEVADCEAHLGARPLDWLVDHCDVDARWCLVHATHTTPDEARRAAQTGAVAGLCPTTEADLGDGLFDAAAWCGHGGRFGIGSDSNLRLSVREELRWLEFAQRLSTGQRNVLASADRSCGRTLYESAAAGGAQALGQPVGCLEPGRRADLVELDVDHPLLRGLSGDDWIDSYLFGGSREMIRSVWVAGECRVEAGRHRQRDRLLPPGDRAVEALRT